ncbi:MAG: hypothetical protein C0399_01435 [Syntrophus sp. (in: bacteria)]|nr:hypothetical protein [Syntrophus sp. (in: bacteria)]
MRRSIMVFAGVAFFLFTTLVSAYAVEITADMVSKEGKVTRNGKIYVKDSKTRVEKGSSPMYAIVRGDKNLFWQINGAERTYVEAKLTPDMKPSIEEKLFGETARKLVGTETVNGYAAKKYEVTVKTKNKNETISQWFSTEYNFPVKIVTSKWTVEYKNIKKGGVADTLFDLPAGVVRDTTEVPDVLH